LIIGESNTKVVGGHILVTTPGFIKSKITKKGAALDLSALKMVVYDEADELFF
jgi:superfamily II DNA/RNA helicase